MNNVPELKGVKAIVLGMMQDAGLPHVGCLCMRCMAAFEDPSKAHYAASLALVDTRDSPALVWLIDATPDIKNQLNLLSDVLGPHPAMPHRLRQPDGLFLTHAHMGHTAGLAQLGPEGMNVQNLALYASGNLLDSLRQTHLWKPVIGNLELLELKDNQPLILGRDLGITPIPVPHRDELNSGTYAFLIQGPQRSLLYVPDIDGWQQWNEAQEILSALDIALVDGSFYSRHELGGRPPVAHPLIPDTLAFYASFSGRLLFTHINHTNPVLDVTSNARQLVQTAGAEITFTGQQFQL